MFILNSETCISLLSLVMTKLLPNKQAYCINVKMFLPIGGVQVRELKWLKVPKISAPCCSVYKIHINLDNLIQSGVQSVCLA